VLATAHAHRRRREAQPHNVGADALQVVRLAVEHSDAFARPPDIAHCAVACQVAHQFDEIGRLRRVGAQGQQIPLAQLRDDLPNRGLRLALRSKMGAQLRLIDQRLIRSRLVRDALERVNRHARARMQLLQPTHPFRRPERMLAGSDDLVACRRAQPIDAIARAHLHHRADRTCLARPPLQAEANDRLPHPRLRRLANRAPVAMLSQNPRVGVEAIDVVPNPPRRDDPLFQVHRRHATHREAIAPVDVGHRNRAAHNPRQERHIRHLLGRLVLLNLLNHLLAGEDKPVHAHPRLVAFGNPPAVLVDLL
jgi:hypothetical protein